MNGSNAKVIIIKLYPYLNIGNFKNQIIVQNNEKENNIKFNFFASRFFLLLPKENK